MSILVQPDTKVLIQGITGGFGGQHTKLSLEYGTQVVAGVTPGKGGQLFADSVPVLNKPVQPCPPSLSRRHLPAMQYLKP